MPETETVNDFECCILIDETTCSPISYHRDFESADEETKGKWDERTTVTLATNDLKMIIKMAKQQGIIGPVEFLGG